MADRSQRINSPWALRNQIPLIGGWLRRRTAQKLADERSPRSIRALAEALSGNEDQNVREIATATLADLTDERNIAAACSIWESTRDTAIAKLLIQHNWIVSRPIELRVLCILKQGRVGDASALGPEAIESLVKACYDGDEVIAKTAKRSVVTLTDQTAVDRLCQWWSDSRQEALEKTIAYARYVATSPIEAHVLTALLTGQRHLLVSRGPEVVAPIVSAVRDNHEKIAREARLALSELEHPQARSAIADRLCAKWAVSRAPALEEIMVRGKYVATTPLNVRVLSSLRCGMRETLTYLDATVVSPLISAAQDSDDTIRHEASLALAELTHPQAKTTVANKLCVKWARTRSSALEDIMVRGGYVATQPIEAHVLSALRCKKVELISALDAEGAWELIKALDDPDEVMQQLARAAIVTLIDPAARAVVANWLCPVWANTRDPDEEVLVTEGRFVPDEPLVARILCALKTEQPELITGLGPEVVHPLIDAYQDEDVEISKAAERALHSLRKSETQDEFCRLVIKDVDPSATEIAKHSNYEPKEDYDKALFFFLAEQWDRYETFDFDHRLMRSIYEAADAALRSRITAKLRLAGRTDFLTVVSGRDHRARAGEMTANETKFVVNTLVANREWDKLWNLVFELPFSWSVAIIRQLVDTEWMPNNPDDQKIMFKLASLAAEDMPTSPDEFGCHIPPAIRRAYARVTGRVSDVAFSPHRPVIAIGGLHQVVVWNFQTGSPDDLYRGFDRSVGPVMFTEDGHMLCAEGRQPGRDSILHGWYDSQRFQCKQADMITSLTPAGPSRVLITRRDNRVVLFDVATQRVLKEQGVGFWPRAACVSSDCKQALLLHEGVALMDIPELSIRAQSNGRLQAGVSRCAAFTPTAGQHIAGNFNGDILLTVRKGTLLYAQRDKLWKCEGQTQGIEFLGEQKVLILACAAGTVEFLSWQTHATIGSVNSGGKRLTSLHVAPGGEFMAIGDTDSSMSFWDLRVMQIPLLFSMPFGKARPTHLGAVQALASGGQLPATVRRCVMFMEQILRYRFRYDIEISDLQSIRAGEFDIEID